MSDRVRGYNAQQVARLSRSSTASVRRATATGDLLAFRPHRYRRSDLVEADRHAKALFRAEIEREW